MWWQLRKALLIIPACFAVIGAQPQTSLLDQIRVAMSKGQFKVALDLVESALSKQPSNAQLWTIKGLAQNASGSQADALASFRKALSIQAEYLPALRGAAEIEYTSRDAQARKTLETVVGLAPESPVAHAMLGVLAFEADDCDAAVSHFSKGGDQVTRQKTALSLFGACLLRSNQAQKAAEMFKLLLELDPTDAKTKLHVALAASALGKPAEAITVLQSVANEASPDVDVLGVLAESYRADDRAAEAIATYRRAIELYPNEERLYLGLASLCEYYNSHELGFEIVDIGLKRIPGSARLYSMRAILFLQTGQPEKAMADFERASEIAPSEGLGTAGLSLTQLQEGRVDDAIQIAREQVRNNPNDPAGPFILAQALVKKASGPSDPLFEEAQAALEKSVKLAPQFAAAHALLGKVYVQGNRIPEAVEQLEVALKLDPANRPAIYQLMVAYKRLSREADVKAMQDRVRVSIEQERRDDEKRSSIRLLKSSPH